MQAGLVFSHGQPVLRLLHFDIVDAAQDMAIADNVAHGLGIAPWPGAEVADAMTSPLWVALLSVGVWCGLTPPAAGWWWSHALSLASVFVVAALAREVFGDGRPVAVLAAPWLVVTSSAWGFWNAAGLDFPLVQLLLAGTALTALRNPSGWAPAPLGATLLAFCQPVGSWLAVALAIWALVALPERRGG